jgi:hypothetical protein
MEHQVTSESYQHEMRVIYYRDFIIEYPKTLASLCLFHDCVLLFPPRELERELELLEYCSEFHPPSAARFIDVLKFVNGPYRILSQAGVLRALTDQDVDAEFPSQLNEPFGLERTRKIVHLLTGRQLPFLGPEIPWSTRMADTSAICDLPYDSGAALSQLQSYTLCYGLPNPSGGHNWINSGVRVDDFDAVARPYCISTRFGIPLCSDSPVPAAAIADTKTAYMQSFADELARSALCQLALPEIAAIGPERILEVREKLKDELLEFRIGISKIAWLLRQRTELGEDVVMEVDAMVQTLIQPSLFGFENRVRKHEDKWISRLLFGTGRVLVDVAKMFLAGGITEAFAAAGKSFIQAAMELNGAKPPEEQVVSYLYHVKQRLSARQ